MSAADCIRKKAAAGKVNPDKAARLAELYDEQLAELRHANAPDPEGMAAELTTQIYTHQVKTRKRAVLRQMKAQAAIRARIEASDDPLEAALAVLDFDPTRRQSTELNITTLTQAIRGQAHARMADMIEKFGSKAAGLPDLAIALEKSIGADVIMQGYKGKRKVAMNQVVRELHGIDTGDVDAHAVAKGATEAMEHLRKTFNAVGGNIPKRKGWGLPQTHNRRLIADAEKEDWVEFILSRTDHGKMIDLETGQPFIETKLRRVAGDIYDDVVENGLNRLKPSFSQGKNIALKRTQRRFWVFKDADSWLEYNQKFGDGDMFQTIIGHIDGMARDTAIIKLMGPEPDGTLKMMEGVVGERRAAAALEKIGKERVQASARVGVGDWHLKNLYETVTHANLKTSNPFWSNFGEANRNILVSARLGGAIFSALADRAFSRITENLNGIPAGKTMGRMVKLFNPARKEDRQQAAQLAFVNEIAMGSAIGAARQVGEIIGPEVSRRFADTVMRMSFLSPWTNWGSTAFGMEFLGLVTSQVGKGFGDLIPPVKRAFEDYGISKSDWDLMRATGLWKDEKTGATFLRAQDIIGAVDGEGPLFERHFDAAMKLQTMILTETEMAVPKKTARVSAATTPRSPPGSLLREIAENGMLFKAFPITIIMTHLRRAVQSNIPKNEKAKYWAHLIIGTAVLGTFGTQLSEISKGKDPLSMDPTTEEGRKIWLKGMSRGGGLGIFGDFIFSDVNRYGGGISQTILGPVLGTQIDKLTRLTAGNIQEFVEDGEMRNPGREALKFARMMMPGQSLWYTTLALERLVFDEAQKMIDPNYALSFRRIQDAARREMNQMYFSPPGSGFPPERGPRF